MYSAKAINKGNEDAYEAEKSLRLLKSKMLNKKREEGYNTINGNQNLQGNQVGRGNYSSSNYQANQYQSTNNYNPNNYLKKEIPENKDVDYKNELRRQMQLGMKREENIKIPNSKQNEFNFHNVNEFDTSHQKAKEENIKVLKANSNYLQENSLKFPVKAPATQFQPQTKQISIYDPVINNKSPQDPRSNQIQNQIKPKEEGVYQNMLMKENKRVDNSRNERPIKKIKEPLPPTNYQPSKFENPIEPRIQNNFEEIRMPKNDKGYNIDKKIKEEPYQSPKDAVFIPCTEGCGRSFNIESFEKHVKVCKKVFQTKRKKFDSKKFRAAEDEEYGGSFKDVRQTGKQKAAPKSKAKKDWKLESEAFRAMIKNAKGAPLSAKEQEKINKTFEDSQNLVQCGACGRKFNEHAAQKHIPFCEKKQKDEMMKNKNKAQAQAKGKR